VIELAGWSGLFAATVSSEQVARGKPAPDVYIEAVRELDAAPRDCVAIEDSDAGIRSALSAGLAVVAIPNRAFPPAAETVARASLVLDTIEQLDERAVESAWARA
jgi:beta-phosphoglucomutase-like phosphatase (HAD superfamily)